MNDLDVMKGYLRVNGLAVPKRGKMRIYPDKTGLLDLLGSIQGQQIFVGIEGQGTEMESTIL